MDGILFIEGKSVMPTITDYDNAAKWGALFSRLPRGKKIIFITVIVVISAISLYVYFGPIRDFRKENQNLKGELSKAQSSIADLRDKKDELHRENLYLKELIDPIKKKAELLYPELETTAAIAKLSEDLQNVRSLATRDVYKPLAINQKDKMVSLLRALHAKYSEWTPNITVVVQQGSSARTKVANDLKQYIEEAGWKIEMNVGMLFYNGNLPDISIEMHPDDLLLAQQFADIVGTLFINKQFEGVKNNKLSRGQLKIVINGDPLFSESGIVIFR